MSDYKALLRELRTLEQIQTELTQLSTRHDAARKAETVKLRRQLAHQLGVLGNLGTAVLSVEADKQLYEAYRSRLSVMRSAIALHQAEWPAVTLDDAPQEYHLSAQRVLKAKQEFTPWAIATIATRAR
jgi:hypothetical protein